MGPGAHRRRCLALARRNRRSRRPVPSPCAHGRDPDGPPVLIPVPRSSPTVTHLGSTNGRSNYPWSSGSSDPECRVDSRTVEAKGPTGGGLPARSDLRDCLGLALRDYQTVRDSRLADVKMVGALAKHLSSRSGVVGPRGSTRFELPLAILIRHVGADQRIGAVDTLSDRDRPTDLAAGLLRDDLALERAVFAVIALKGGSSRSSHTLRCGLPRRRPAAQTHRPRARPQPRGQTLVSSNAPPLAVLPRIRSRHHKPKGKRGDALHSARLVLRFVSVPASIPSACPCHSLKQPGLLRVANPRRAWQNADNRPARHGNA
jgi:hypothetical protein